jgi:membrane fusion protein, multidrug efflux system
MPFKFALVALGVVLVGGAAYLWNKGIWTEVGQAATSQRVADADSDAGRVLPPGAARDLSSDERAGGLNAVRVVTTPVRKGEVPIYLSGIGTVQAYYSVNVKAQVDGVILRMPFQEGQDVKIGDTLVVIDPQEYQAKLELSQALKARATVQLENAKTNLWRDEELLKHQFATEKQTDAERMLVGQYTAEIAQYDADIKYAQAQLDYATIRSTINGRIGIRQVDPGNLIRAQDNLTMVTVVQLQPISVIITLSAKELEQHGVSLGITNLPVVAYAENGLTPLGRGEVQTVNNVVDQTTGTIKLKANFANEQEKLWPGDFVDCRIIIDNKKDGLTVPSASVRQGPKGDYVWVITPNNTADLRPVRVRQSIGGTSLIEGRIQEGENVVLDGYQRLQVGSRVDMVPETKDIGSRTSATE